MKVYCNNLLIDGDKISQILEPGFIFGWGVFETLRVYNGKIAFLQEHINRLKDGAGKIALDFLEIDYKKEIERLLKENNLADAYCRITIFKQRKGTGIIIYVAQFNYYQEEEYTKGVKAIISPFKRNSKNFLSTVKSISYLENRLAWKYAQDQGQEEAIFLNEDDYLAEGSRSNIFFVKEDKIFTPGLASGILPGITRAKVIDIISRIGLPFKEGNFRLEDLYKAQEVFITSSLMEVMAVVEINNQVVNGAEIGKISHKLREEYKKIIA